MAVDNLPCLDLEKSNYFIASERLQVDEGYTDFLGEGAFGKVFRCHHESHGFVAVKMFDLTGSRDAIEKTMIEAQKEVEMMTYLQKSSHVVDLYGVTKVDDFMLGIVMEYLPRGCLSHLVQDGYEPIPWPLALRIIYETAAGLSYLHNARFDKRITHNDLKPENVLLDENFHAKLCDFGGSNLALHSSLGLASSQGTKSDVYTINYVAPEYLQGSSPRRTRAMDVYSFGKILYFVLMRKPPFHEYDSMAVMFFIKNKDQPYLDRNAIILGAGERSKEVTELLITQMNKCSRSDSKERPQITEVEEELKKTLDTFDESVMVSSVKMLNLKIPLKVEEPSATRISLPQKCKKVFVKKLHIPFDDFHCREQNEVTPLIRQDDRNVKATMSSNVNAFADFKTLGINEAPRTRQRKATCSTLNRVTEIDIPEAYSVELQKGDKVMINCGSKVFTCYIQDSYIRE